MSQETLEQLPPINPDTVETVADETPVETLEEIPEDTPAEPAAPPEWSKPLQKMQEKQANFQRDIMAALTELRNARSAPAQEAAKDELADLLEESKKFDEYIPGYSAHQAKVFAKVREALAVKSELPAIREAVQNREEFAEYMADKPAGFREAYTEAQNELLAEAQANGDKVTKRELQLALGVWAKQWLKENKTAPQPRKGAGGKPVIPAPAARRSGKVPDQLDMESNGYVPDGKGSYRPGNKLGR